MKGQTEKRPGRSAKKTWLMRIWGMLPFLFFLALVVVIGRFAGQIQSEQKRLEAEKKATLKKEKLQTNVVTLKLRPAMIRDRISLPGIVAPWKELKVLAEIRGKVVKKNVKEGNYLKKGDIIAKIDDRDYRNTYLSAQSSHGAALASLERIKALYKDQLSTRSQLDEAVARTRNLKFAMDNAALNLERCVVRAAMSGIVERLYFEAGQYVKSGDMLAKMIRIDRVKVKVGIPESDVDAVRKLDTSFGLIPVPPLRTSTCGRLSWIASRIVFTMAGASSVTTRCNTTSCPSFLARFSIHCPLLSVCSVRVVETVIIPTVTRFGASFLCSPVLIFPLSESRPDRLHLFLKA